MKFKNETMFTSRMRVFHIIMVESRLTTSVHIDPLAQAGLPQLVQAFCDLTLNKFQQKPILAVTSTEKCALQQY